MRVSFVRVFATAAIAALALAACGSSSKSGTASTATTAPQTTVASTEAPTTTAGGGAAAATTVALKQNAKVGKAILVDDKGMTLYVWDNDKTANQSSCDTNAQCAQAWPAYYVTGTPTEGAGLNGSMFTTITAPNGQKQLAVNGKPLYYWFQDKAAGDTKGNGVNGFYVVGANGDKIDES
jgi:predicted lipoprotein with Yx(FWY)xxD motif